MPSIAGGKYLGIDYRNGWMATNGTLADIISIARLISGFEWHARPTVDWRDTWLDVGTIDTSNAFVFEGFLATLVQTVRFTDLNFSVKC